jgi:hypothetical protein
MERNWALWGKKLDHKHARYMHVARAPYFLKMENIKDLNLNTILSSEVKLIKEKKIVLNDFEAHAVCLHIWYFFLNVVNNEEQNYFFLLNHFILIIFFKETCTFECIQWYMLCAWALFFLKVPNINY